MKSKLPRIKQERFGFTERLVKPIFVLFALLLPTALLPVPFLHAGAAPTLLLTEIYYDTPGRDEDEEWIEIVNTGHTLINLSEYKVGDEEQIGQREGMLRFPAGATLSPGQVIVVAQSTSGFRTLFNRNPDYEVRETDASVPNMESYALWATGDLALNNNGDEVLLVDSGNAIVDAVNYGERTTFFAPAVNQVLQGQSIERTPAACDTDTAADWQRQHAPTPGGIVGEGECRLAVDPTINADLFSIGEIQGAGEVSPQRNNVVTFRGIVTGIREDRNVRGIIYYTLFVQEPAQYADGDPATSDGIAVFLGRNKPSFRVGDDVLVTGQVTEFYGLTEIDDDNLRIQRLSEHNPLPPAVTLKHTMDSPLNLEPFEGMRVVLPRSRVVGPTFSGCGFSVVPDTMRAMPIVRERLEDDVSGIVPVLHWSDVHCDGFPQLKVGDHVEDLQGPLTYHFEQFKIVHQKPEGLVLKPVPLQPLPEATIPAGFQFSVATFNLENHFDTHDDGQSEADPVLTSEELRIKQAKLEGAIVQLLGCPTLLGVQEVENEALLQELVERLMAPCGFEYQINHRESSDRRGIDVALLSNAVRVDVRRVVLRQACGNPPRHEAQTGDACPESQPPLFSRPPLVVDLRLDGEPYTVLVNHFKSKREGEAETAPRRLAQAGFVRAVVDDLLLIMPHGNVIVMGDFNDYPYSAPMSVLSGGGKSQLHNAMLAIPKEIRYSYNFGGVSQLLDTILLTPSLAEKVAFATIIHTNADFPAAWATDPTTPLRASDHDIPFIILETGTAQRPSPTSNPVTSIAPSTSGLPEVDTRLQHGSGTIFWLLLGGVITIATLWLWRR